MKNASKALALDFSLLHLMKYKALKLNDFLLLMMRKRYSTGNIEKRKGLMQSTNPFSYSSQAQAAKPFKACIYNKRATAWLKA